MWIVFRWQLGRSLETLPPWESWLWMCFSQHELSFSQLLSEMNLFSCSPSVSVCLFQTGSFLRLVSLWYSLQSQFLQCPVCLNNRC